MKRISLALMTAIVLAATFYIASPFYAAWQLREAIRAGDSTTVARRVDFIRVRHALRRSISSHARLLPAALGEPAPPVHPTLWQRLKTMLARPIIDRFIKAYITPDGLTKLYRLREKYEPANRAPAGIAYANAAAQPTLGIPSDKFTRAIELTQRIKRAAFLSFTQFEIEIADRRRPLRHYIGRFDLIGNTWKLTAVEMIQRQHPITTSQLSGTQ